MMIDNTPQSGRDYSENVIKSVETSIAIIESMKANDLSRVGEIADATGISKSNVSKHVNTLTKHGFLTKQDGEYQLGFRYLDLGGYVQKNFPGAYIIEPKIQELASVTDEVAQFAIEDRGKSVILYRKSGNQGVSTRTRVGRHLPIHQVASGKAMLAHMPDERVDEIVETYGLVPATENTITDADTLRAELEEVAERNYAVNDAESTKGLYAVAAPVRTSTDEVVGACAVSGPTHRMKGEQKVEHIVNKLLSCVNEIELDLEYS